MEEEVLFMNNNFKYFLLKVTEKKSVRTEFDIAIERIIPIRNDAVANPT